MLGINERVPYLVRFTEPSVAEWSACRTFGDPGVASQQQRFFLENPEFTCSCLGRGWEDGVGAGGRYSLAEWSARRTCYPQAVPASSPSPTTSLTCLFCRPKFKSTATLANNQLVFSCNWGSCYGFYWIIFFYSFEWSPSRTAGKISALPLWTDRYLYLYSQLPASGQLVIIFNPVIICLWLFEYRACFFKTLKCSIIICFICKT